MKVIGSLLELMNGTAPDQTDGRGSDLSSQTAPFDAVLGGLLQQPRDTSGTRGKPGRSLEIGSFFPGPGPAGPAPGNPLPVDVAERIKSLILQLEQEKGELSDQQLSNLQPGQRESGNTSTVSFDEVIAAPPTSDASTGSPETRVTTAESSASSPDGPEIPQAELNTTREEASPAPAARKATRTTERPNGGQSPGDTPEPLKTVEDPPRARNRQKTERRLEPSRPRAENHKNPRSAPSAPTNTRAGAPSTPPAGVGAAEAEQVTAGPSKRSAPDAHPREARRSTGGRAGGPSAPTNSESAASRTIPHETRSSTDTPVRSGRRNAAPSLSGHSSNEHKPGASSGRTDPPSENRANSVRARPTTSADQPHTRETGAAPTPNDSHRPIRQKSRPSSRRPDQSAPQPDGPENSRSVRTSSSNNHTKSRSIHQPSTTTKPPSEKTGSAAASSREQPTPTSRSEPGDGSTGRRNASETTRSEKKTAEAPRGGSRRQTASSPQPPVEKNGRATGAGVQNSTHGQNSSRTAQQDHQNSGGNHRRNPEPDTSGRSTQNTKNEAATSSPAPAGDRDFGLTEKTALDREIAEKPAISRDSASRSDQTRTQDTSTRRSARPGQSFLSSAWRRAIHNGSPRSYRLENGWHVLTMELDDEKTQMTVKTRAGDDKVSVSVGMSDPKLRSLVAAHTERLQATLRTEYDADIDFSLSGNDGQSAADADGNQSSGSNTGSRLQHAGDQTMDEETPDHDRRALYGSFEWIG